MAGKKNEQSTARYDRDTLLNGARAIFGESREVVAGALQGLKADDILLDEAKSLVDQFTKRKVL